MTTEHPQQPAQRSPRRRRGGRGEEPMVPDVEFTSYYGRPIVRPAPWQEEIPAYMFFGGLAAGSSLLAAGADLTDRPNLRRAGRLAALGALGASMFALIHDLGRPERFLNMMRVIKPTSPMSVGTWILAAYGPGAAVAGAAELARWLPAGGGPLGRLVTTLGRPAGLAAAAVAPGVASYTGILLADTATPAWHSAYRELPALFVSSAAAAAGGLGMICAPLTEAAPARRLAVAGAASELVIEHRMEQSMGLAAETMHAGRAGRLMAAARWFTAVGGLGAALLAGRSRSAAIASGAALLAGSACTRFGVFEAGQASARNPKYTVVPQRERLQARAAGTNPSAGGLSSATGRAPARRRAPRT